MRRRLARHQVRRGVRLRRRRPGLLRQRRYLPGRPRRRRQVRLPAGVRRSVSGRKRRGAFTRVLSDQICCTIDRFTNQSQLAKYVLRRRPASYKPGFFFAQDPGARPPPPPPPPPTPAGTAAATASASTAAAASPAGSRTSIASALTVTDLFLAF